MTTNACYAGQVRRVLSRGLEGVVEARQLPALSFLDDSPGSRGLGVHDVEMTFITTNVHADNE